MFDRVMWLLLAATVLQTWLVCPLPQGAPNCLATVPQHEDRVPQSSPPPFRLTTSPGVVDAGDSLAVFITSPNRMHFKGFMLRVVPAVGLFQVNGTSVMTNAHTLDCDRQLSGVVTHNDNTKKTKVGVTWLSPSDFSGNVTFKAAVVQNFTTFWVNVTSIPVVVRKGRSLASTVAYASSATPENDVYTSCGQTRSCFGFPNDCIKTQDCTAIVAFAKLGHVIVFELLGLSDGYVALGISEDDSMGSDSVRECVQNSGSIKGYESYNFKGQKTGNERLGPMSLTRSSFANGLIQCSFQLESHFDAKDIHFDLIANNYYLLLAVGPRGPDDSLTMHINARPSRDPLNFTKIEIAESSSTPLAVVIHGSLMIVSWIGTVSVAVFLARYYKQMWPETTHCKVKVWFAWHRLLNLATVILTSAAFILIFVYVDGWSSEWPANPHPLLGVITTALMLIQPIMAIFRCDPTSARRPIFNWLHFLVGMSAIILSIVTLFYTVTLRGVDLPQFFWWILVAYVAFFVVMYAVMEFFTCLGARKTAKDGVTMQDFSGGANGFALASGDVDATQTFHSMRFKQVMLILFTTGALGFTVALVIVICTS